MSKKQRATGFGGLGIAPGLLAAIARLKFTEPTPIQRSSIPVGLEGKDLIAIAQTGTGKTLAFGIPVLQRLAQLKGRALVLLPTRELAEQVSDSLQAVGKTLGLGMAVVIGGVPEGPQKRALKKNPRVIIATPGRLVDLMERREVNLSDVRILVLDEADRMLDMGFAPQLNKIIRVLPEERQTMLFSATLPSEILTLARKNMTLPINIEMAPSGTAAENIIQEVFFIEKPAKSRLLEAMLAQYQGPVLVFSRTKHGARKIARILRREGFAAAEIHSDRTQGQRRDALEGFKSGKYRILVATDIAARGIDVVGIELVVNYDLPNNTQDYVHRIGRTARAGMAGRAISFATLDQRKDIKDIERLIKTGLSIKQVPPLPPRRVPSPGPPKPRRRPRPEKKPSGAGSKNRPKRPGRPPRRKSTGRKRGG
ncbi:DEAD/DEAH box helicase [candidate division GN15 bacterium]|nr:DEAD/DEAH box helicase [candidate division GN15 bacterium]